MFTTILAGVGFFLAADLIYTLRHYFIHHDTPAYMRLHQSHHDRYVRPKDGRVLDATETWVYTRSGLAMGLGALGLTLLTGNPGFVIGAGVKWVHNYVFHIYQHAWWGRDMPTSFAKKPLRGGWGIASARYHAFHHYSPMQLPFTFSETWAGFDRLLEIAHPWLVRFTADARREKRAAS